METVNYYEHHLGDYAEATAHLSFVEDAAYSRCIRKYYTTEKPLPAEVSAVQRLVAARSKDEKAAVEAILKEFFTLHADGWHNRRCDEEIARYQDKQSKAKRSANARWSAKPTDTGGNANAMRTHSEGNALQSPVSNLQSPVSIQESGSARENRQVNRPSEPEGLLDRLRSAYPRGIYPQSDWLIAEREARRRIDEGESVENLIAGVQRYAAQCAAKGSAGTQYVESPKKFFTLPECKFREPFPLPVAVTKTDTAPKLTWRPPPDEDQTRASS